MSWQVSNIGETAATGGWKENFYLVGDNNTELFIGSNSFESTGLAPGASVSRSIELTLPEVLSVEGAVKVKVNLKGNSDSGERSEAEWNNTATQETGVSMVKTMQLVMPETAIAENQGKNVRLRLNRSGSRTAEETFTLACDKPDRLSVPATVTISKNQSGAYFYVNVVNNDTYDNDDNVVTITATGTAMLLQRDSSPSKTMNIPTCSCRHRRANSTKVRPSSSPSPCRRQPRPTPR